MSATEFDGLLMLCEGLRSKLGIVVTVNARHLNAFDLARDLIEVISNQGNGGLCFVAGNPAYLSEEERQLDAVSRIRRLVETGRKTLPSAPIFVGSEGILEIAAQLAAEYSVIPFMLLDASIQDRVSRLQATRLNDGTAVYSPCYLSGSTNARSLIQFLGAYALRRRWVRQELRKRGLRVSEVRAQISSGFGIDESASGTILKALRELALTDRATTRDILIKFLSIGVRYLAVLPADDGVEDLEHVSRILGELQ